MKKRVLAVLLGTALIATQAMAQQPAVTGKVTRDGSVPLSGVSVGIKGTSTVAQTNANGDYTIRAAQGQVLQFRLIGYGMQERTVGTSSLINVTLEKSATNLDAMVVTALGQTAVQRTLGVSQQTVVGADVAQTGRENFINGLQGRVAGVEVTSSSGMPGASSSITIRGVSSISSSNQPLMIVDGLPLDNKTLNTQQLAADAPNSQTAFANRGLDFTNRAADINPEDIETMVVLKGPEAAALYGIDAANGAIVITTKRGQAGTNGWNYVNNIRTDAPRGRPEIQRVYGPSTQTGDLIGSFAYFGAPYPAGTTFYDNVDGFFKTAVSQQHNLMFSGGNSDGRLNYRIGAAATDNPSIVPGAGLTRYNLTGATQAQVASWLRTDLSMQWSLSDNDQALKGGNGPLIGLLLWPQTDNAKDYLTPSGQRRRITALAASSEQDNPYFSVRKNTVNSKTNRLVANLGLVLSPVSWGNLRFNVGQDGYTNENQILRHPETAGIGFNNNGVLDIATDVVRNINAQTVLNFNRQQLTNKLSITGLIGNQINDTKSNTQAAQGMNFLDPNFVSINNTVSRLSRSTISQRRQVGLYAQAVVGWDDYLYVTVAGRNDWTSTIPVERNSFFYPSVNASFVVTDAFPALKSVMSSARLRGGRADVGRDARPYAFRPSLEYKTTTKGGYGYGFTGPNVLLEPEFATSYEYGADLGFFDSRLNVDITTYKKETSKQIVNDIRGSYATGFVLFNLNGADTRNTGLEVSVTGQMIRKPQFSWDILANFDRSRGKVLSLPNGVPESYISDGWLYGFIRPGVMPGTSTRSMTGRFYLRNNEGKLLIDPTTGLPLINANYVDAGYDRQPDYTLGVTNTFRTKNFTLSFLLDVRRGGDVLNGTQHFLTTRGLTERTLDREQPRVIDGVMRDGKENSPTPTKNTIVVIPAVQTGYYVNMSEELFIEKDINWFRLRDLTLRYNLPPRLLKARDASLALTLTDLFVFTNYSGLDPIVNGNTAAVGGSGGVGIDFGNFPMPRGIALSLKVGY
ncbi:SusC/RagA family TonB-linked outer membrane protein [Gemmatimonas aurantiaca]|uniref:SusC/RagA family TonB-linked outer membrane protein n=1 Tax=Gemmatimonas aurantiaca TaxID=173480 RepID=UPI00301CFF64